MVIGVKGRIWPQHVAACQKQRLRSPASCFTLIYTPAIRPLKCSAVWQAGARLNVWSAGGKVGLRNGVLTTRLTFSESILLYIIYAVVPLGAEGWIRRKKRNQVRMWVSEESCGVCPWADVLLPSAASLTSLTLWFFFTFPQWDSSTYWMSLFLH